MGQVYKARHARMDRVVALKTLPSSAMRSAEAVKRFQQEVKAAAKLSHPNIVTAYDADEAHGIHFLVMEYVAGQDLAALVREQGALKAATAVEYVLQVARGLEYAHRQGVVHRDIKPSNLLVDANGTVKILDMGLARVEGTGGTGDMGLTHSGQVMGTLDFMSPEQALDTRHVDGRTDIYSLGCTLYYMLTGRPPYGGDTMTKKILAHRQEPIPSLRAARPDVPEALDAAFRQMLAKNPAERQSSMAEVIMQLSRCGLPASSGPPPLPPPRASLAETERATGDHRAETATGEADIIRLKPSVVTLRQARDKGSGLVFEGIHRLARRVYGGPGLPTVALAIGLGVVGLALLLGIVFLLRDRGQTVRVEIDPALVRDATVTVWLDGKQMEIAGLGATIKLKPGAHGYEIRRGDEVIAAREFTVLKDGNPALRIDIPAPRQSKRWLGYEVSQASKVPEFSGYTNLIWTYPQHEGPLIEVSRNAGQKVVLNFEGTDPLGRSTEEVIAAARRYGDGVSAICWQLPYERGRRPSDVSDFGQKLERSLPKVELWCNFGPQPRGRAKPKEQPQPLPVPPEVDVIVLEISLTTPDAVEAFADDVLPEWRREAAGRPVLLCWWNGATKDPQGLVSACSPGTFRAYARAVERYDLSGLVFAGYGRGYKDTLGIETSPVLLAEIKQIAKDWGIARIDSAAKEKPSAVTDVAVPNVSKMEPAPDGERPVAKDQQSALPLAIAPFDAAQASGHQRVWATRHHVPAETTNSIGMKLVLIPPGEFQMGSPEDDSDASADEKPQHVVRITKPFYLGATSVTQAEYEQVMGSNPSHFKAAGPKAPVEQVSWEDAVAFCRKLSEMEGQTYRLPTEAEWEYACRAGSKTKWPFGDDESALQEYAWYTENAVGTTHPVAQKKPNAWGLYDMPGNVWEWCQDWYDGAYYKQPRPEDPQGPAQGSRRVIRGGCWGFGAGSCRSAYRDAGWPEEGERDLGFRVARSPHLDHPR
jgi:formylglycine-generating enzyme required for sulfatase activity